MVLEYVVVGAVVCLVTGLVYFLGVVGTKETSFEDALAEQRMRQKGEGPRGRRTKGGQKGRNGATTGSRTARSTTTDETPATTEDDAEDLQQQQEQQLLLKQERQRRKELEKQQKEQDRRQKELEKQQQKEQKELDRQRREQERQQRDLERQQKEQEEQKQRDLEEQQEQEEEAERARLEKEEQEEADEREQQELREQAALEQARQQNIAEQENTKNKKHNKKHHTNKQQAPPPPTKTGVPLSNGVNGDAGSNHDSVDAEPIVQQSKAAKNTAAATTTTATNPSSNNSAKKGSKGGKSSPVLTLEEDMTADVLAHNNNFAKKNHVNGTVNSLAINVKKAAIAKADKGGVQTILQTVENAQLSSEQLQSIVESLLAMASEGGWSEARKSSDFAFNKKLEEATATIARHQETQSTLTTKISDLRTDLNTERSKTVQLKKTLESAATESSRNMEREATRLAAVHKTEQAAALQQLQQLQEQLKKTESNTVDTDRTNQQLHQLQQQHQMAMQTIQDLQTELQTVQTQMQYQTDSSSHDKAETEARLHVAHTEIARLTATQDSNTRHIVTLEQENATLAASSVRAAADGQENNNDAEQRLASHQADLLAQSEQVAQLTKQVAALQSELRANSDKNDELRNKNRTVLEALQNTEDRLRMREETASNTLQTCEHSYRQLLHRLHPGVCLADTQESHSAFVQQFESAAVQQRAQQDKDREVEVVEVVVEKVVQDPALQERISALQADNESLKKQVSSLEQRLGDTEKQLADKSKQLNEQTQQQTTSSTDTEKMQKQNKELHAKVLHYQGVLDNTETLLKTLQASVESEEIKWLSIVENKEKQLDLCTKENERLVKSVNSYIAEGQDREKVQTELESVRHEKDRIEAQLKDLKLDKASEVRSLQEMVTVGQEATKEQDTIIVQLQKELVDAKASSNGPAVSEAANDESGVKQ